MIDEARQLYTLPPGEFTSARNGLAKTLKADGRADDAAVVAKLRRPRLAEHALNRVAHADSAIVERLLSDASTAADAQSAAIGGAKNALREATAALRTSSKAVIDAAVEILTNEGASGEAQRDEITELVRSLLTGSGAAQLRRGVIGYEGLEEDTDPFAGAPDPPATITIEPRVPAKRAAATRPPSKPARAAAATPKPDSARAKHKDLQAERTRLMRLRRETAKAVDDAERAVAVTVKDVEKAQRKVTAAEAALAAAQKVAEDAERSLAEFERSQRD